MSIKRMWLNPVGSPHNGWMKYGIEKNKEYGGYDHSLTIADCNRVCDFSFDFENEKGRKKGLKKLRMMRDALTDMIQQVEAIE